MVAVRATLNTLVIVNCSSCQNDLDHTNLCQLSELNNPSCQSYLKHLSPCQLSELKILPSDNVLMKKKS